MSDGIEDWLRSLGLEKYAEIFLDNEIDFDVLPDLQEPDLEKLGLPMGPRKKLLRAIASPGGEMRAPNRSERALGPAAPTAERRQLTVMFCDLVGSTELSARLDPEDMREVLRRYQDTIAGVISRHEGYVANYLGDGVLAYFGWPRAHEDQAAQAVDAGLAAVAAVADLHAPGGESLAARVGIASGQVVVGDLEIENRMQTGAISGETPNLAARLQALAEPGRVVVDGDMRALTGRQFEMQDLGQQSLKGIAEPVPVWQVLGHGTTESRFATRASQILDFIGREHEMGLLLDRWALAGAGDGQVVVLSGEAGIGKSRLIEELRQRVIGEGAMRLTYQCAPQFSNSAFWPVIRQLQRAVAFGADDAPDVLLDKLEAIVGEDIEAARLFAYLLGLPGEARYGALDLSPEERKRRIIRALLDQLVRLSAASPVLFLFEDAHWIDPTTSELLTEAVERIATARVMMVVTTRPEWQAPWTGQSHATTLSVTRLGRSQASEIVAAVAGRQMGDGVIQRIIERADGIPLFVEELTRALVERGQDGNSADIPATLQASLAARLDRLAPAAREIAQVGAVIGRRFSLSMVAAVMKRQKAALSIAIDALLASGLVQHQGSDVDETFRFKHALVQDAAYQTLLHSRRRVLHQVIADISLAQGGTGTDTAPEVIAHHLGLADDAFGAATHWLAAARNAIGAAANREAIAYLEKAHEGLAALPPASEKDELELDVQITMASAYIAAEGYAAEGTRRAYARGRQVMSRTPFDNRHAAVLYGLFVSNWNLGRYRLSERYAQELVDLAEAHDSDEGRCVGYRSLAVAYMPMGRFAEALTSAQHAYQFYDSAGHRDSAYRYGHDIGVAALSMTMLAQANLGLFDEAQMGVHHVADLVEAIGHPATIAYGNIWSATVYVTAGLARPAIELGRETVRFARERGMAFFASWAHGVNGAGLVLAEHDPLEALAEFRESNLPFNLFRPYEAEALRRLARLDDAAAVVDQALAIAEQSGEHWMTAELYRVRAAILGDQPAGDEALRQALSVAHGQGAIFSEIRAARDLATRLKARGDTARAIDILRPSIARLPVGLKVPDGTAACDLLAGMATGSDCES